VGLLTLFSRFPSDRVVLRKVQVPDRDPNRSVDTCESTLLSFRSNHKTDFCELRVGSLCSFDRFLALSRFKLWWLFPKAGKTTIPNETQFLLLQYKSSGLYVCCLPTAHSTYRCVIKESSQDQWNNTELKVQISTGSKQSQLDYWDSALCISVAERSILGNPFGGKLLSGPRSRRVAPVPVEINGKRSLGPAVTTPIV